MKQYLLPVVVAAAIGIACGWIARGFGNSASDQDSATPVARERGASSKSVRPSHGITAISVPRWMPKNESAFLEPRSPADRAEVQRLLRRAIEKEPHFHARMKAVADLLALMTPENAHDIRDAFVNSRKDGYWYGLERKVFLARYGEIMGAEAMEEFKDDPDFVRILESWALVAPTDAVEWVNGLQPGRQRDDAISRLIGAFGSTDIDYAVAVFDSLTGAEQERHQQALTEAAIRSGGKQAATQLAKDLLGRDREVLKRAGERMLRQVFDLYKETDERLAWLRSLSSDHLALLDPSKLPEEFRPVPKATDLP